MRAIRAGEADGEASFRARLKRFLLVSGALGFATANIAAPALANMPQPDFLMRICVGDSWIEVAFPSGDEKPGPTRHDGPGEHACHAACGIPDRKRVNKEVRGC